MVPRGEPVGRDDLHDRRLHGRPDLRRSLGQVADSVLPFVGLMAVGMWVFRFSIWLSIPLCVLAAGFMARTFIILFYVSTWVYVFRFFHVRA